MIGVIVKTVFLLLLFLCAESKWNISQLKAFMAGISFREKGKTETHLILTKNGMESVERCAWINRLIFLYVSNNTV